MKNEMFLVVAVLGCAAVGFFAGALFCCLKTRSFLRAAQRADGVVVANAPARNGDGGETFVPIVRFAAAGGALVEIAGSVASNPPAHRIGERVGVAYLPKRPHDARILTFFNLYWLPLMFLIFAAATAFAAMVFLFGEAS